MTYNKWPSPHGHSIASHVTDKLPVVDDSGLFHDDNVDYTPEQLDKLIDYYSERVADEIQFYTTHPDEYIFTGLNMPSRSKAIMDGLKLLRAQPQAVAGGDEPKYHYNYSTALMNIEFEAFEDGFIVLKSEEGWHFKVAIPTTEKYSPIPQPEAAKVALDARVDDLVSLLGRFVHKTRDMAEMADLRTKTLDYLSRKGLTPSPLREVE